MEMTFEMTAAAMEQCMCMFHLHSFSLSLLSLSSLALCCAEFWKIKKSKISNNSELIPISTNYLTWIIPALLSFEPMLMLMIAPIYIFCLPDNEIVREKAEIITARSKIKRQIDQCLDQKADRYNTLHKLQRDQMSWKFERLKLYDRLQKGTYSLLHYHYNHVPYTLCAIASGFFLNYLKTLVLNPKPIH